MRYRLRNDRLRRELARRQISQNRWAQMLGLSKSHLSMLVNGQRPYPEEATRRKLQEGLGVRLDELFDLEHDQNPQPEHNLMESLLQDVRHGWRALRARPLFVSVIVLTLSVGIGATTALYSVIEATLLRPLPFEEPSQIVRLFGGNPERGAIRGQLSMANTLDWRARTRAFDAIATYRGRTFNVSGSGDPERTLSLLVADQYLELLRVAPVLGRTFSAEEHLESGSAVALISDAMWRRRFDRSPTVLGRTIRVDTVSHVIVGVLPPEFENVRLTLGWDEAPDLVMPLVMEAGVDRSAYWQLGIGRLAAGATVEDAAAEAADVGAWLRAEYPDEAGNHHMDAVALEEVVASDLRGRLLLFFGAATLVLLVGCVNVANLMLVYATSRRREVAIRKALGAGKLRLVRLILVESLMLAGLGGVAGVLIAAALLQAASPVLPDYVLRHDLVGLDWRVLLFSLTVSVLTALAFGIAPALGAANTNARDELSSGVVGNIGRGRMRLLSSLAVVQIALAGLLAIGSGLVVKSYASLVGVDPGFASEQLLTLYTIPRYSYASRDEQHDFVATLLTRLETLPGVQAVGETNFLPFTDNDGMQGIEIEGRDTPAGVATLAQMRAVNNTFFSTLGLEIRSGRDFLPADMYPNGAPVALIDQTMADRYWPEGDAIGQRFRAGSDTWFRIVGIAPDIKWHGYDDAPLPHMFLPYREDPWSNTRGFLLRVDGDPMQLAGAVREAVRELNPDQSIYSMETMEQRMAASVAGSRFSLRMLVALGMTALLLAAIGTYGMFANSIGQRAGEIGIRLALGARAHQVQRAVLLQSMGIAAIGVGLALVGARLFTGSVSRLLFEVPANDPTVLVGASALMLLAGLIAAWLPARRAAKMDPAGALRN